MKFDPVGIRETAKRARARGAGLHDLPEFALAHVREAGEEAEALGPYAFLWAQLPDGTTPDLDGVEGLFEIAGRLSQARAALFRRRYKKGEYASEAADRERRIREVVAATDTSRWFADPFDAAIRYQSACARISQEEADTLRRAEAEVELLERSLADQLRVVWATAAKRRAAR